jgi:hypothetical protein
LALKNASVRRQASADVQLGLHPFDQLGRREVVVVLGLVVQHRSLDLAEIPAQAFAREAVEGGDRAHPRRQRGQLERQPAPHAEADHADLVAGDLVPGQQVVDGADQVVTGAVQPPPLLDDHDAGPTGFGFASRGLRLREPEPPARRHGQVHGDGAVQARYRGVLPGHARQPP